MTNRDRVKAKLTALFDGVREAFRASEQEYFKNWADRQFKAFTEYWANPPEPKERRYGERPSDAGKPGPLVAKWHPDADDVSHGYLWWSYGDYDLSVHMKAKFNDPAVRVRAKLDSPVRKLVEQYRYSRDPNKDKVITQAALAEGLYWADHRKAVDEANGYVKSAEENFLAKQSQKIAAAIGDREITALEGRLALESGCVTGSLTGTVAGGDKFTAIMEIKTNYRYGENAANRKLTVYAQYPTRFKGVVIGGAKFTTKSEKWMADNFAKAALPS